jgi:threonine/homoserine/homoserine lactone efflux protein
MAFAVLLKGILAGMIIAVPAGPVGILCIRRTIVEGRLAGLSSGLGAASADAIFGAIAGFGLTFLSDLLLGHQDWLRILGAIFLFYFGGRALLAEPAIALAEESGAESLAADFASAFALSITNPLTILAFLAIFAGIGCGGARATYEGAGMLARFARVVAGALSRGRADAALLRPPASPMAQPGLGRAARAVRRRAPRLARRAALALRGRH